MTASLSESVCESGRISGAFGQLAKCVIHWITVLLDARIRDDEGTTWSPPVRIADFESDGGYPSSAQLPDGRVLTAFYARRTAGYDGYQMGTVVWDVGATLTSLLNE